MLERMLFRLYLPSVLVLIGGWILSYLFITTIPSTFAESKMLSALATKASLAGGNILWITYAAVALMALYSTYRFWSWSNGNECCCKKCGGVVSERNGRYGPYLKCLACSKTTDF